ADETVVPRDGLPVSITYTATDGSTQTITVTINGSEDSAGTSGVPTGTVAEDGTQTASGALTITDADSNDNPVEFADQAATVGDSGYGSFMLTGGTWTYTLNNTAVQFLDASESVTDSITYTATDGSTQTITVTINGSEDSAVIGGVTTGTVAEDGTQTASGALTITDADSNDNPVEFADQAATVGDSGYGSFMLTGGTWTYTLNNTAVQFLDASESVTDSITYTATDGSTQTITVTINGSEDSAVIGGVTTGTVAEDGTQTASGALTITDADSNDNPVEFADQAATVGDSGYGSFMLTGGTWTYTLNNTAVQFLDASESVTDSITYTATDGSTQTITVTINGSEDTAVIGGVTTGTVAEDGTQTASGALTITDADSNDNPVEFADQAATVGDSGYGSFVLTGGTWTYTLTNSPYQTLDRTESVTDSITYTATDGSTQTITVPTNGSEDSAVIGGVTTGTVAEDDTQTDSGALTITDAGSNDKPVEIADAAATVGDDCSGSLLP